jgi:hypothetical protein
MGPQPLPGPGRGSRGKQSSYNTADIARWRRGSPRPNQQQTFFFAERRPTAHEEPVNARCRRF